jgi:hypothetical protein
LRWLLWVGALVLGFGIGEGFYLYSHYPRFFNLVELVGGIAAMSVVAPIVALPLALLGLLRTKPVDLLVGISVALLVGAIIGAAAPGHELEALLRLVIWGGFVFLGHFIGRAKNRARTGGLLGLFLGPVGLIIILSLPKRQPTTLEPNIPDEALA